MRPLTAVGVGLALVVLDVGLDGVDLIADPIGWLLVLLGCLRLPRRLPGRPLLAGVAAGAGTISLPLWLPSVREELGGLDASLLWVLDLPQVVFVALLALVLARAADADGDLSARGWWRLVLAGAVVMVLLPPAVYGAGAVSVLVLGVLIGLATVVAAIVLCVRHSDRPWIDDLPAQTAQGRPS